MRPTLLLMGRPCFFVARDISGVHPLMVYTLHVARTNVEIDEPLVKRVMSRYSLKTKRAAIDLALRRLDMEPMSRREALDMRGSGWEGDLREQRAGWLPHAP
jgi:Arc/MetJ family transcription regulator